MSKSKQKTHQLFHVDPVNPFGPFYRSRNDAQEAANKSGCSADWLTYCQLRFFGTKLYRKENTIPNDIKHNGKSL